METKIKKVLVTGAHGFIGKNLVSELNKRSEFLIFTYDTSTPSKNLEVYCKECDFIFHLAGINRSEIPADFYTVNVGFTKHILSLLQKYKNYCPVMMASSTQATLNNPYGKSKRKGEELIFFYGKENNVNVFVYRFPNIFGKWSRPNYNSVVATFCYNISHDLPIQILDENKCLSLAYIDDVVEELILLLYGMGHKDTHDFGIIPDVYPITIGELANLIHQFRYTEEKKIVSYLSEEFVKKMYSTYLSYAPI